MKDLQEDSLIRLGCEEVVGEDAGKIIMESFEYQAEKIEPCLSSNCCSAVPTAWGAFPLEHATDTRTQFITSESTSPLPKSMFPFNFPLWVMAPSFKQSTYQVLSVLPNTSHNQLLPFFFLQSTSLFKVSCPCLSLIASHLDC